MNGSSRVSVFLAYLTFIFCSRLSIRLSLFVAVGSLNEKLSVFLFDSSPLEDLWSSGRSKINKNRFLYGYFPLNMEGENSSKNVFFNVVRLFCLFVFKERGRFFPGPNRWSSPRAQLPANSFSRAPWFQHRTAPLQRRVPQASRQPPLSVQHQRKKREKQSKTTCFICFRPFKFGSA